MVEKVQPQDAAVTAPATPAVVPTTQARPAQGPQTGGAGPAAGGSGAGGSTSGGGSMAGPLDHLKRPDDTMGDPDGHCVSCGSDLDPHTWTCPDCHESVSEWNKKVDDFTTRARAYGWTDDQIRERGQQFFNEQKQAGAEADQGWQTAGYADTWIRNYGR